MASLWCIICVLSWIFFLIMSRGYTEELEELQEEIKALKLENESSTIKGARARRDAAEAEIKRLQAEDDFNRGLMRKS